MAEAIVGMARRIETHAPAVKQAGALLAAALFLALGSSDLPAAPIVINERPQLFVDEHLIATRQGLTCVIHQPRDIAVNPVIVPDRPWEHRRIPFGSVLWFPVERKFKCWYLAMNIYDSRPGFRGYRREHHVPISEAAHICYAESVDGIRWTKPALGLHAFRGSTQNNIVLTCPGTHFDSTSVMHLPEDKEWPYRMITFIGRWPYKDELVKKKWGDPPPFGIARHGHYAFGSRDGIHWRELNDNEPVLRVSDRSMFWWDNERRIFIGAAKRNHNGQRAQAYAWSRDMIHWTVTSDWIHIADERDHPDDEAEAAYGFRYGTQWLGIAEMRRVRKGQDTKINWELLTSRDGRDWSRPMRELFFSDAGPETWRHLVFKIFANPPIEQNGQLLIFYGGKTGTVPVETGYEPFQALCLATLRKDGFVSLNANRSGELTTQPLRLSGPEHSFNYSAAPNGSIRVEVCGVNGGAVPGFTRSECQPLTGDHLDRAVRWNATTSLAAIDNRSVYLRILLNQAELYSLRCRGASGNGKTTPSDTRP